MKTRMIIGLALVVSVGAFAQEYDDMYFRSKDREKLQKASKDAPSSNYENFKKKHFDEVTELDEYNVNPTDSYSARNINPEYIARLSSEQASEDESNYFVENYKAPGTSSVSSSGYYPNSNWNNRWYNPMYSGMYGSYYNNYNSAFYSPYYGYNDPWSNPYYCRNNYSGWSMSSGYYWGNSFGSGWNYGLSYGNPYYGSMWGPSYYTGFYRPYTTIVVVGESSRPNYGKRPTHSSANVGNVADHYSRRESTVDNNSRGRTRSTSDEYYVRPSRRTYTDSNSSSTDSNNGLNTYRSYNANSGSNGINRDSRSSSYSTPSRTSGGSGMSTPTRSSSSGSSGSSSGSSSSSRRGGN